MDVQMDFDLGLLVERLAAGEAHRLGLLPAQDRERVVTLDHIAVAWRARNGHVT